MNVKTKNQWIVLSLILLAVCFLAACGRKTVVTAGNEFEANQMFDVLHSNGFQVEKSKLEGEIQGWEIIIDEGWFGADEAAAAIQVLRDYGLPRPPETQVKTNDSFGIISEREEKERQKRDLQMQIERQLYTLPDVIRASVIIAQPANDALSLEKIPPTASVSLVLKETQPKFSIADVQNLVSGGVPNLKPENVKVTVSQQALREIPFEKLAAARRSNAIFVTGIGLILLLGAALGAVWLITKRRRKNKQLAESATENELSSVERPALTAENEE